MADVTNGEPTVMTPGTTNGATTTKDSDVIMTDKQEEDKGLMAVRQGKVSLMLQANYEAEAV